MKYGFILGTFNPPTVAHISLVSKVLNEGLVDEVYFVPTVQNPWKPEPPEANFEQRCDMLDKCSAAINTVYVGKCKVLDVEKDLFPPYYSCNTLDAIYKQFGGDANELFVIGGADVITSVHEWLNFETMIKGKFKFIGFTRGDIEIESAEVEYQLVESDIPDISSTIVRDLISNDKCAFPLICSEILEDCSKIYQTENFEI